MDGRGTTRPPIGNEAAPSALVAMMRSLVNMLPKAAVAVAAGSTDPVAVNRRAEFLCSGGRLRADIHSLLRALDPRGTFAAADGLAAQRPSIGETTTHDQREWILAWSEREHRWLVADDGAEPDDLPPEREKEFGRGRRTNAARLNCRYFCGGEGAFWLLTDASCDDVDLSWTAGLQTSGRDTAGDASRPDPVLPPRLPPSVAPMANGFEEREDNDRSCNCRTLQAERPFDLFRDALTGLPDRRALWSLLGRLLNEQSAFSLLFVDLDGFKSINDQWGHLLGDRVLSVAAARLQKAVRPSDLVVRYGGDEFAVVLADVNVGQTALAAADRILGVLAAPLHLPEGEFRISASAGIALSGKGPRSVEELLAAADRALYAAKHAGGRCAEVAAAEG